MSLNSEQGEEKNARGAEPKWFAFVFFIGKWTLFFSLVSVLLFLSSYWNDNSPLTPGHLAKFIAFLGSITYIVLSLFDVQKEYHRTGSWHIAVLSLIAWFGFGLMVALAFLIIRFWL